MEIKCKLIKNGEILDDKAVGEIENNEGWLKTSRPLPIELANEGEFELDFDKVIKKIGSQVKIIITGVDKAQIYFKRVVTEANDESVVTTAWFKKKK